MKNSQILRKAAMIAVLLCAFFGLSRINATKAATAFTPSAFLDLPVSGATVSGAAVNVEGWALDNIGQIETAISKVEVYVDGTKIGNATYGIPRPDVCKVYPNRVGCPNVGFQYTWDTTVLSNGQHFLSIFVTDNDATPHLLQLNWTNGFAVTVSNASSSSCAPVVGTYSPVSVGTNLYNLAQQGFSLNSTRWGQVAVSGRYAYVTDNYSGFDVFDVSNPANPTRVGSFADTRQVEENVYDDDGNVIGTQTVTVPKNIGAFGIDVAGNYAYVGAIQGVTNQGGQVLTESVEVVDISTPTAPRLVKMLNFGTLANWSTGAGSYINVKARGNYVYVGDTSIHVVDVSNPSQARVVATIPADSYSDVYDDIDIADNYLYATEAYTAMNVVDISNPVQPRVVGKYAYPSGTGGGAGVAVSGTYAYLYIGGHVVDVSNPTSPREVARTSDISGSGLGGNSVVAAGKYVYTAAGKIVDVSNPTSPQLVATSTVWGSGIALAGQYLYVAGSLDFTLNSRADQIVTGGAELYVVNVSACAAAQPTVTGTPYFNQAGFRVNSVACGASYTFAVDGYSYPQVWLTQTKNDQANYNGVLNVPYAYTSACNRDEGTYVNTVFAYIGGQKGTTPLGTVNFTISSKPYCDLSWQAPTDTTGQGIRNIGEPSNVRIHLGGFSSNATVAIKNTNQSTGKSQSASLKLDSKGEYDTGVDKFDQTQIKADEYSPGAYKSEVVDANGKFLASCGGFTIIILPQNGSGSGFVVDSIVPPTLRTNGSNTAIIRGRGFTELTSLSSDNRALSFSNLVVSRDGTVLMVDVSVEGSQTGTSAVIFAAQAGSSGSGVDKAEVNLAGKTAESVDATAVELQPTQTAGQVQANVTGTNLDNTVSVEAVGLSGVAVSSFQIDSPERLTVFLSVADYNLSSFEFIKTAFAAGGDPAGLDVKGKDGSEDVVKVDSNNLLAAAQESNQNSQKVAPGFSLVPCGRTGQRPCTFEDIFVLIARVTNWLIALAGVYAVYEMINNGFWLVVTLGNEEAITKRKSALSSAVIGFVLVLFAYMFVNTAVNYLLLGWAPEKCKIKLSDPLTYLRINDSCMK
jgi:hypothetical protein